MKNKVKALLAVLRGNAIVINEAEGNTEVYLNIGQINKAQIRRMSTELFKVAYNLN